MPERTVDLWTTHDRRRYFLVPHGQDLPPGDLAIRAGVRRATVAPDAAAPFEVDEPTARAHLNRVARDGWETLRQRLDAVAALPALDELLGAAPADVVADGPTARAALRHALENLATKAGRADAGRVIDERLAALRADLEDDDGRMAHASRRAAESLAASTSELDDLVEQLGDALTAAAARARDKPPTEA